MDRHGLTAVSETGSRELFEAQKKKG